MANRKFDDQFHYADYLAPTDNLGHETYRRNTQRRRARDFGNQALQRWRQDQDNGDASREEWTAAKNYWTGGAQLIRKEDHERVNHPLQCENCRCWFPASRSDQKTCSGRCRVALHYRRKREAEGKPVKPYMPWKPPTLID